MDRSLVAQLLRVAAGGAPLALTLALAAPGRVGAATAASTDSVAARPPLDVMRIPEPGPSPWPSIRQVNAPSINSASPDLVDHGAFPAVAGVAWDERLEKGPNDGAITVNVTPLAFAGAVRRDEDRPSEDEGLPELMRRVAARVTIGGPLQQIERSNASRAGRPTNHVTSELKMILLGDGSTDRDSRHAALLALALAADNLASGYGLDRYGATIIAEREAACTWTANAGYRVVERFHSPARIEETKLAAGAQWRMFEFAHRPVEVGLSGGCLLRNRGPADWQDDARVDVPIASGLRLSAAVRGSHRPEMPGQGAVREVVSLAYGMGGL